MVAAERENLIQDIQKLKAEREEAQRLLTEMKKLLAMQQQMREQGQQNLKEKKALETQIARLGKEKETIEQLAGTRVKEYEANLSNSRSGLIRKSKSEKPSKRNWNGCGSKRNG